MTSSELRNQWYLDLERIRTAIVRALSGQVDGVKIRTTNEINGMLRLRRHIGQAQDDLIEARDAEIGRRLHTTLTGERERSTV